ncbi:hypothetical protein V8E51_014926 [Hyaloscypha variabilis]
MSLFRNIGSRRSRRVADMPPVDPVPDPEPQPQPLPPHERQLEVNPQKDSLFYDGTIPAEIRDQIFFYSVQEFLKTDEASIWPINTRYTRPGYSSNRKVDISLLLTCRRIYLETCHLPALKREHVFFHGSSTAPQHQSQHTNNFGYDSEVEYFRQLQPWQLALVKEIHLFTQMFWLEHTFVDFCQQDFMRNIERLKLTIRRGDWWWNERNHPLVIAPHRDTAQHHFCVAQMHQDIAVQGRGGVTPFAEGAWGLAFKHLPSLKEVEIEFETSDDKKAELETIVKWAKTWKFPLKDGLVLSTEGLGMTTTSWQSPYCYWSHQCPYCGSHARNHCNSEGTPNEEKCAERSSLRLSGLGPTCYMYGLRWRIAQAGDAPRDEYPEIERLQLQEPPLQQPPPPQVP